MRDEREFLRDVLDAIEKINRYAIRGYEAFEQDELIQNWITSHLQIIGESCNRLPHEIRDAHPEVPWSDIIGMRHILVHNYFDVNLDIVWTAVENDLPSLRTSIEAILKELDSSGR